MSTKPSKFFPWKRLSKAKKLSERNDGKIHGNNISHNLSTDMDVIEVPSPTPTVSERTDGIETRTDNIHKNITEQKEKALYINSDPVPQPTTALVEVHAVQPSEIAPISEQEVLPCPVEIEDQSEKKPCASGTTQIEDKKGTDDIKDRTDNIHKNIAEQNEGALYINLQEAEPLPTLDKNIAADYCDDLLESQPVYQDYQPLPDEIHQKLKRVCVEYKDNVLGLLVIALPNNGVVIFGANVKSIELEIVEALAGAKLSKIEVRNIHTRKDNISYTDYLSGQVTKLLFKSGKWKSDKKTVCELIVKANDPSTATDDQQSVYSVVPAHLILSTEEIANASCMYGDMSHIRKEVKKQTNCEYEFSRGEFYTAEFLQPPPLFAHRQWDIGHTRKEHHLSEDVHETGEHYSSFMNYIALLKFSGYESYSIVDKTEIFAVPTSKHLDLLAQRQQGIIVGDLEGRLIYPPQSVGASSERFGLRLAFVITSKDSNGKTLKLKKGDSGLTVFLKGKRDKRFPVGMLVGKFSKEIKDFGSDIYQAVVLSQALKEIEHDYPHIISHIQLLEICDEPSAPQKKGFVDGLISLKNRTMQALSNTLQHIPAPKRRQKEVSVNNRIQAGMATQTVESVNLGVSTPSSPYNTGISSFAGSNLVPQAVESVILGVSPRSPPYITDISSHTDYADHHLSTYRHVTGVMHPANGPIDTVSALSSSLPLHTSHTYTSSSAAEYVFSSDEYPVPSLRTIGSTEECEESDFRPSIRFCDI